MIKVPTGWRVYYWCTLLSQSKPCDLRVTRRVNSLFPSNSNLPRLPGWPWLRTPCCLAGLADCLLCSPPVLSSCLAVPLTHVWTAASTARHRQAHHTTPHHTTPHHFSRVLKLGPQIFFWSKLPTQISYSIWLMFFIRLYLQHQTYLEKYYFISS